MAEQDQSLLVLDVRERAEYLQGTVPGARHAGPHPVDGGMTTAVDEVVVLASEPPDSLVVEAWKTHLAAVGVAFSVLAGGLPVWRTAGLPVAIPQPDYAIPGQIEFQIPRGLCEALEPVQRFPVPDAGTISSETAPSPAPPIREAPP